MIRIRQWLATGFVLTGVVCVAAAHAELKPYEDFDFSDEVYSMTVVKVDANRQGDYLEGLRQTWAAANDVAKELGHIKDYRILASELPESGDFNLVLLVEYASGADLEPSKERYDEFMERWGEANEEQTREISKEYPELRTISGEYRLREITLK